MLQKADIVTYFKFLFCAHLSSKPTRLSQNRWWKWIFQNIHFQIEIRICLSDLLIAVLVNKRPVFGQNTKWQPSFEASLVRSFCHRIRTTLPCNYITLILILPANHGCVIQNLILNQKYTKVFAWRFLRKTGMTDGRRTRGVFIRFDWKAHVYWKPVYSQFYLVQNVHSLTSYGKHLLYTVKNFPLW